MTGSYRLGVDVGGTFTDVLLVNEIDGSCHTAKVLSTPDDSSLGVLTGIEKVCRLARIEATDVTHVMHGTTVATNTILTGSGATVGLIVTEGYRQILQIARSFVPGGLGAWVIYNKSDPIAPLELTLEVKERIASDGAVIKPFDEDGCVEAIKYLADSGIEALTICLINSFANASHELQAKKLAKEIIPDIPISISSDVIPEMQEYERAVTTVANSYVRPRVEHYISNLAEELMHRMGNVNLNILRSDGGLSSSSNACNYPVNLLMSGPAGGVTGAIWVAKNSGYKNLLTLDMGGTSTDVALIQDGKARLRRETTVGDVTVKASSVDIRTVGAGGGSIVHVPELTGALRVGPQSAGAEPGPASYGKGGLAPTVTDASVVLGYLPSNAQLGGDLQLNVEAARSAIQGVAEALDLSVERAAEGVYNIVNENMFGALRLVSIEQGYDPREFALIAFGGAGPLHANALGKLMGSWPVIIPPGPGVLCAYGDATTRARQESSRTFIRSFKNTTSREVQKVLSELETIAKKSLDNDELHGKKVDTTFQIDLRYQGQGLTLPVDVEPDDFRNGLSAIAKRFDVLHKQLFTFSLEQEVEIVNLRAVVLGASSTIKPMLLDSEAKIKEAHYGDQAVIIDGERQVAPLMDRKMLGCGGEIVGPAIVTEMDSTILVLPDHVARIDDYANILISPTEG